jgi:hypothetical protein
MSFRKLHQAIASSSPRLLLERSDSSKSRNELVMCSTGLDRASDSTIGRALKKTSQAPSPASIGYPDGAFVAAMEDVLSVDTRCAAVTVME